MISRRFPVHILLLVGLFLLYCAVIVSVTTGPMDISLKDSIITLLPDVLGEKSSIPAHIQMIIQEVRIPRTLLAATVGGILALCGAVTQGLFRNPLADPGIIGVSAGAALGAAMAVVLFGRVAETYPALLLFGTVPFFAFIGGTCTTFIVYHLGNTPNGTSVAVMLLAGVAISAMAGAGLGLMNYLASDQALRSLSLWTMGSLAGANNIGLTIALVTLFLLLALFYRDADKLNALLLGEPEARHMGIDVQALKRRLILLTAAGMGITVALAGIIGFVGLIVPHLGRFMCGPNHRSLLPLSVVLGALLLVIADIAARTVVAPLDMPVGIVTALIGAPFFLGLLIKQKGRV